MGKLFWDLIGIEKIDDCDECVTDIERHDNKTIITSKSDMKRAGAVIVKMIALSLMMNYASHIGIVMDELITRWYSGWYDGILRVVCIIVAAGIFAAWYHPEFDGFLHFKVDKKLLPVFIPFVIMFIADSFRFKTLSLDQETIIRLVSVAIVEEMEYRAIVCSFGMKHIKDESFIMPLAVLSGLLFGFDHLGNVLVGQSTSITIGQVFLTTGVGILYSAIYLRSGNAWVTCILHFSHNYACALCLNGVYGAGASTQELSLISFMGDVCYMALCIIFASLILRPSVRQEALALWNKKWNRTESHNVQKNTIYPILCSLMAIMIFTLGMIGINKML